MSKLKTLIVGRKFRCRSCKAEFTPDPNNLKCPKCGKRYGEDEAIKELEKTRDSVVEI